LRKLLTENTIHLKGSSRLPFSVPMLFSSENSESSQNINTLNLSLDASVIKDFIIEKVEREKDKLLKKKRRNFLNLPTNKKINWKLMQKEK
jgi:hypothetical protein